MLDNIEYFITFSTWLLFAASFFYGPIKSRVDRFLAFILFLEYTIWPVWVAFFPAELPDGSWSTSNEMLGYEANIIVYSIVAYLLVIRMYFAIALGYIAAISVVILNMLCVTTGWFQWAWDNFQPMLIVIMAYIVIAAFYKTWTGGKNDRISDRLIVKYLYADYSLKLKNAGGGFNYVRRIINDIRATGHDIAAYSW